MAVAIFVIILIGLCVRWIDRPFSTWSATHLHAYREWFDALTHIVDPFLPLSALAILAAIAARLAGRNLVGPWRSILIAGMALAVAVMMKDQGKYLFGRLWPETWVENNPSWIGTGSYGFFPLHGGRGWASFPSGHMTVITAPATTLSCSFPRLRPLLILACAAVAVGLLGADYHFLSDVIAGTGLGVLCGWVVLSHTFAAPTASICPDTPPADADRRDHAN
ncbi:phosphatase PAP2 family protein [Lichenifustis flavocetrariae]|uniref:Phosphatase PAP2 family protein n=1 Tax=Lichenifustis flavocetrariae TaxID=2949735 RepID=A0AA42CMB0_9HYPH|nr:phosphatase PAP2 family protein [Lichenifustis flavocetrariae]MCW6508207.1 phosphatase PAP2 family protein [Lichenifustis flavocetrariae]